MNVLLIRQDPPFNINYITATYLLEHLNSKTFIINNPKSVRDAPEKLHVTYFKNLAPPTLISQSEIEIEKFIKKHKNIIVKPLYVSSNTLFFSKYRINDEEINNYFIAIIFFILNLFILSGILSFENLSFKNSITLSILALTNTVNSSNYNLNDFSFLNLNVSTKFVLCFFMISGRVELLSFLILIKKFFFK